MKKVMKLACLALLGFMTIGMRAQDDADATAGKAPKAAALHFALCPSR